MRNFLIIFIMAMLSVSTCRNGIPERPSGAKIFGETEILPGSRPIGQTPKTLFSGEPGMASVHLWKEGFRDSVVEFYVNATTRTLLEINLTPISSPEERKAQEVFQTIQRRMFWGRLALGCAIAPAIAGGIFLYMSEKDRDKAKDIKKELEMPSSGNGKNFRALVRKNHHYADRSKGERYVGAGFLLAPVCPTLMMSVGVSLLCAT